MKYKGWTKVEDNNEFTSWVNTDLHMALSIDHQSRDLRWGNTSRVNDLYEAPCEIEEHNTLAEAMNSANDIMKANQTEG